MRNLGSSSSACHVQPQQSRSTHSQHSTNPPESHYCVDGCRDDHWKSRNRLSEHIEELKSRKDDSGIELIAGQAVYDKGHSTVSKCSLCKH
jgi:hypothetical protein